MQFLNPIWLLSGLGIIIPIAIHLWNQRPGKILEVGSVRFLEPNTNKRNAKLEITELLLLIIRCLLILLLAFFLAKPNWNHRSLDSKNGWLLIPAGYAKEAYQAFPNLIDSLLLANYQFHLMEKGFPAADFKKSLEDSSSKKNINYWQLGFQVANEAPKNSPVWIFTPTILKGYQGQRPFQNPTLHWLGFPVTKGPVQTLAAGFKTSNDSIEARLAIANKDGFEYQKFRLPVKNNQDKNFRIIDSTGAIYLQYQLQTPVLVDQSIQQISIFTDQYSQDAQYLFAAIKSISDFSRRRINCKLVNRVTDIPEKQDWIFWLSNQPVTQKKATNILYYQKGDFRNLKGSIYQTNRPAPSNISLYRTIPASPSKEIPIWEDGFGKAVLQKDTNGRYQLNTHFDPEWNGLVWNNQFPAWIMALLFNNHTENEMEDIRQIDVRQILPIPEVNARPDASQSQKAGTDISGLFWLLLCLFLAIERTLTYYQAKNRKHA